MIELADHSPILAGESGISSLNAYTERAGNFHHQAVRTAALLCTRRELKPLCAARRE